MNSLKIPDRTQSGFQQKPALVLPVPFALCGNGRRDCGGVGLLRPGRHPQSCSPAPGHVAGSLKSPSGFLLVGWELGSFLLKEFQLVHI